MRDARRGLATENAIPPVASFARPSPIETTGRGSLSWITPAAVLKCEKELTSLTSIVNASSPYSCTSSSQVPVLTLWRPVPTETLPGDRF